MEDIRKIDYGRDFDLAMMLFGEINAFSPEECKLIIEKIYDCLKPGGVVLIEAHIFDAVKRAGQA